MQTLSMSVEPMMIMAFFLLFVVLFSNDWWYEKQVWSILFFCFFFSFWHELESFNVYRAWEVRSTTDEKECDMRKTIFSSILNFGGRKGPLRLAKLFLIRRILIFFTIKLHSTIFSNHVMVSRFYWWVENMTGLYKADSVESTFLWRISSFFLFLRIIFLRNAAYSGNEICVFRVGLT